MTAAEDYYGRNLGVVVTGKIGHRGSNESSFLELLRGIRQTFPDAEVVFSSSSEPSPEICRELALNNCKITVRDTYVDSSLTYGMNSLIRQTHQVQEGLSLFSSEVSHVIRLRSDWSITNLGSLREFVASNLDGPGMIFLDLNWPKFPILPSPWQGNDYVTFGSVENIARFWAPFEDSEIRSNKKIHSRFSLQFHFYRDCNAKSVEQMLFRRHFENLALIGEEGSQLSELRGWAKSLQFISVASYDNIGVSPPRGALSQSPVAKVFFGFRAVTDKQPFFTIQVVVGYLIGYVFFWLHPMWVWPRLRTRISFRQ